MMTATKGQIRNVLLETVAQRDDAYRAAAESVRAVVAMRAQLDEAVELLRTLSDRDNYEPYFLAIVDAFLSRIAAGKVQS